MNKVYVVTSGSYSDYSIDAVFSTRALAEEWINGSGAYDIEEYDIDNMEEKRRQYVQMKTRFDTGHLVDYDVLDSIGRAWVEPNEIAIRVGSDWAYNSQNGRNAYIQMFMLFPAGTPEQDALKVASEKRAQLIALHPAADFLPESYFDRTTLAKIDKWCTWKT